MSKKPIKGLLFLAFGGADSLESVEPFVKNVLKGRHVGPELVAKAVERYKLIGGRSPLLDITNGQAKAVEESLNNDASGACSYKSYVGMRYWHPFIADTVRKMHSDGIEEAIAVVMSPFNSLVATGAYESDVRETADALPGAPNIEFLHRWHLEKAFVELVAANVKAELAKLGDPASALVVFSSHSLPMVALQGDPYEMMVNQSAALVMEHVGKVDYRVAFQSRGSGPREWLGPQTESVIEEAASRGKKAVVVVPLGFAADHVETLYDIDILFRDIAASAGLAFGRTPSLNTDQRFTAMLAALIKKVAERRQ